MALYFGVRSWTGKRGAFDPQLALPGSELPKEYCEKWSKQNGHFRDKETPPLAGQAEGYLLYSDERLPEGGQDYAPASADAGKPGKLSDEDLVALAEFYASNPAPDQAEASGG